MIVHYSVLWSCVSENDSLAVLTDEMKQDINKTETKLQEGRSKSGIQVPVIPVWVPYKTLNNLTELPIGSIHKVTAIGYAKHCGTDKLVVQLEDGTLYQAGEFLERTKEDLLSDCKIIIEKYRVDSSKRKFVMCKIVQQGDWSGLVDYKQVPMLSSKNKYAKVLDVKTVTNNSQKRKLVLLEDGNIYKIKKSKLEGNVKPGLKLNYIFCKMFVCMFVCCCAGSL